MLTAAEFFNDTKTNKVDNYWEIEQCPAKGQTSAGFQKAMSMFNTIVLVKVYHNCIYSSNEIDANNDY